VLIVYYEEIIFFSVKAHHSCTLKIAYIIKAQFNLFRNISEVNQSSSIDDGYSDINFASFMTCLTIFTDFTEERFHCLFSSCVYLLQAITVDFGALELGQNKESALVCNTFN
jgi:hypothetical protein